MDTFPVITYTLRRSRPLFSTLDIKPVSFRIGIRAFAATLALFATTACASSDDGITEPGTGTSNAKGSSTTPALNVAGTWATTVPGGTSASVDSTRWSLFLSQRDDRLEGSLTRISYIGGQSFLGTSAIKRGSISGSFVSLEFDRGEGAETATTFGATVSDDRTSMTGFHSRYPGEVTLVRR